MWNIQDLIRKGDYDYALIPVHPNATKNGYVLYHFPHICGDVSGESFR